MNNTSTISINKIRPFEGHPYKVLDNDEMNELINSIREHGILSPLIVRPLEGATGEYEIISGHRRFHAAQKAGLTEVPAYIYAVSRDEAAIMLVDSNLHREHILPSEKAFAYKMKMEAMKNQGRRTDITSCQLGTKSRTDEKIAENADDSARQIQRYIRLTYLIPELLDLMDEGRIAFSVGVELSYLPPEAQQDLIGIIDRDDCTPSYSQANRMHKLFSENHLTPNSLNAIMSEEKANQREKISFMADEFRRYFPRSYTPKDMERAILTLVQREYARSSPGRDAR